MTKQYTKFTHEEMDQAFKLVQDKEHWKNPIDSVCTSAELPVVLEAIEYFTATQATVDYLGVCKENNGRFEAGLDLLFKVRAKGYRLGPAGDN